MISTREYPDLVLGLGRLNIEFLSDLSGLASIVVADFGFHTLQKIGRVSGDLGYRHRQLHVRRDSHDRDVLGPRSEVVKRSGGDHVKGVLSQKVGGSLLLHKPYRGQGRGKKIQNSNEEKAEQAGRHDGLGHGQATLLGGWQS